jgi:hypothetical protein
MKKLKLDIDNLKVESFETTEDSAWNKGTGSWAITSWCITL